MDFIVFDVFLREAVEAALARQLLLSTVWFDTANGEVLVSHSDDGLAFPAFKRLAQVL